MEDYSHYRDLLVAVKDSIATLTLNRPEAMNAVTSNTHQELRAVFPQLGQDSEVAAIIVTGAGRGFCAGADQKAFQEEGAPFPEDAPANLLYGILSCPQPIIAAVNGAAVGLGATLALYCDVVIASDKARFGDLHVKAGVVAGDGGSIIWPLLVGLNKAKELLLTADIVDAQEAYRIGLVQRLVPHDKLMEEAWKLATQLANSPAQAIRGTKQAVNKLLQERTTQSIDYTSGLQLQSGQRPDRT